MKKLLSVILSSAVALCMSFNTLVAVCADISPDSSEKSENVNIDYNMDVSYTVTIPASVTFTDSEKKVERPLQASNVLINEGTSLNVSVASLNNFKMKNGESYIDYNLMVNYNAIPQDNSVDILIVNAGEKSGWAILSFASELNKDHAFLAGNYTDTLTFNVSVS